MQKERELRQELDELCVQNERKLLAIRRDRHQFVERYFYLCRKAELISKRCAEQRDCEAGGVDNGADLLPALEEERKAKEPEAGARRGGVCYGSTNLPPLWLSGVKDVADYFASNADSIDNRAKRKPKSHLIGTGPQLPARTRKGRMVCATLPQIRVEDNTARHYQTTLSDIDEEARTSRFPPIGNSDRGPIPAGRFRGRLRPLVRVLVGLLKGGAKQTGPVNRRRSHEKVLLTMDELSTCRYLRKPNDPSAALQFLGRSSEF